MRLIKLDAIDSTNDFLKALSNKHELENFTVVTAEEQTKGRGQMGASWQSESGKNLIMSVFVSKPVTEVGQLFYLNIAVSLALLNALEFFKIPDLSVKWPNDIMSYKYKIAGILIENNVKSDGSVHSVIGIGLNVNQQNFENLPKASSMAIMGESIFERDKVLVKIVENLKENLGKIYSDLGSFWEKYERNLFKKGVPVPFKLKEGNIVMGIIQGVSSSGKLQVLLEDSSLYEVEIKEIEMLY